MCDPLACGFCWRSCAGGQRKGNAGSLHAWKLRVHVHLLGVQGDTTPGPRTPGVPVTVTDSGAKPGISLGLALLIYKVRSIGTMGFTVRLGTQEGRGLTPPSTKSIATHRPIPSENQDTPLSDAGSGRAREERLDGVKPWALPEGQGLNPTRPSPSSPRTLGVGNGQSHRVHRSRPERPGHLPPGPTLSAASHWRAGQWSGAHREVGCPWD